MGTVSRHRQIAGREMREHIHHHVRVRQTRKLLMIHRFVSGYTARCPLAEGARLHHSSGRVAGRCGRSPRHRPAVRRTVRISLSAGPDGHHSAVSRRQQLLLEVAQPASITTPVRTALCFSSHISSFS